MSELLTSLDVVNQAFKKTMRGYDPAEVDEFLDRVAESMQAYVQKLKDDERVLEEQAEKLKDYENLKGSLHEALLMAQRTAEEKITGATRIADEKISQADAKAQDIVAEARVKAEEMMRKAERDIADLTGELQSLQELKETGFASVRSLVGELTGVIDRAESTGKLQIPESAVRIFNRLKGISGSTPAVPAPSVIAVPPSGDPVAEETDVSEAKKQELSNALNALGIDPALLNLDASV